MVGKFSPPNPVGVAFNASLYVCPECGYIELFDTDPERTAAEEVQRRAESERAFTIFQLVAEAPAVMIWTLA